MHKCVVSIVLFQKLSATAHVITSRFSLGGFGCSRKLFAYIGFAEKGDVYVLADFVKLQFTKMSYLHTHWRDLDVSDVSTL